MLQPIDRSPPSLPVNVPWNDIEYDGFGSEDGIDSAPEGFHRVMEYTISAAGVEINTSLVRNQ